MVEIVVKLENREEHIPFYTTWAAVQRCKEIAKCEDVLETYVIHKDYGYIIIHFKDKKLIWVDGFGEF